MDRHLAKRKSIFLPGRWRESSWRTSIVWGVSLIMFVGCIVLGTIAFLVRGFELVGESIVTQMLFFLFSWTKPMLKKFIANSEQTEIVVTN